MGTLAQNGTGLEISCVGSGTKASLRTWWMQSVGAAGGNGRWRR